MPPHTFDDFEASPVGQWGYGPTSGYSISKSSLLPHSGASSLKVYVGAGDPHYWALDWGLSASSLMPGGGPVTTLGGATQMKIWIKSDQTVTFYFHWVEGNSGLPSGADGEDWYHPITVVGGAGWQPFNYSLASFVLSSAPGNGIRNTDSIAFMWCDYYTGGPAYPAHTLYFDDLTFF